MPPSSRNGIVSFLRSPMGLVLCLLIAAAGVWLWLEHQAHVLAAAPFLLPLAVCLGMHTFMHGGHGGHGHGGGDSGDRHNRD